MFLSEIPARKISIQVMEKSISFPLEYNSSYFLHYIFSTQPVGLLHSSIPKLPKQLPYASCLVASFPDVFLDAQNRA